MLFRSDAGADAIVIDTAHGHSKFVIEKLKEAKKRFPNIDIVVGNKNYGTDLRNQASHELCKRIVDSGVLDEAHLPFI